MDDPGTSDSRPILVDEDRHVEGEHNQCHDSDFQAESDECDDTVTGATDEISSVTVVSLLDRLRSPTPSDLARKRSVQSNPPVGRKRSKKGGSSVFAPKNISPYDRIKRYPGESLTLKKGKLFCSGCREEISTKSCVIKQHVKSTKHQRAKERLKSNEKREMDLVEALQTYSRKHHPVGENLPEDTRIYRLKVVTAFLKAGIPLSKVDNFRDILEEPAYSLCDSSKLIQLLPFILERELMELKQSIEGKPVSVIFDGPTHVCEALVIVLRYVDDNWDIKQKVCRLCSLQNLLAAKKYIA